MARTARERRPGSVNWPAKILEIPQSIVTLVGEIAQRKSTVGHKYPAGRLLAEWIEAGALKEAKRLRMDTTDKKIT